MVEAGGHGDPQRGSLQAGTGTIRRDLSPDSGKLRLLDPCEGQARDAKQPFASTARRLRKRWPTTPEVLAPLKLHYLRWVLFEIKGDTYFMYQGIFDTDFDKYIEDAVALFASTGITTVFTNLEGFPENWQNNVPAIEQVLPGTSMPQLPGVCRIPLCDRR